MDASELDFELPEALIAQAPPAERDAARLLVLSRDDGALDHRRVLDLPSLLEPALFVVNDTRVLPARVFARKPTGGRVEILLLERRSEPGALETWAALARGTKSLRVGMRLEVAADLAVEVRVIGEGGEVELALSASSGSVRDALEEHGHVPLPPYIRRAADASDAERYQTLFARHEGSVAAPTAGLHFSERLLAELDRAGHRTARVTLHVGPGTFAPLRTERLEDHVMHEEAWEVPEATARAIAEARAEGRPVVAVGTTVVRTLESACDAAGIVQPGRGRTAIFIHPPYAFRAIDALFTNFHLPRSTLLALVMAFAGEEPTRRAYREAVAQRYRFFSYGDAMLVRSDRHRRRSP